MKQPTLSVQKSASDYQHQLQQLTNTAFFIAYTALWNAQYFSAAEIAKTKAAIQQIISEQHNPIKQYNSLIQRILLTRQYWLSHPGHTIHSPSNFFNPQNKLGYHQSATWFQTVLQTREAMPLFKIHLKAFAEAAHEILTTQKPSDFHYWRSWFAEQNKHTLLNLLLSTIANAQNTELQLDNAATENCNIVTLQRA
ncbi:hypothetical protein ACFOWM_05575 [Ferruginibacter yonginensis]|uniref:Uncharacterized protein n=1 Tax=Ferruginibacter yonginensis TaxID=1310416 RepID=A0ABV8QPX6_9BACT